MTEANEEIIPLDTTVLAGSATGAIAGFLIGLETYDTYFESITEQPEHTPTDVEEFYDKAVPPFIFTIALIGAGIGAVATSYGRNIIKRIRS